jgi:hypothetical protein
MPMQQIEYKFPHEKDDDVDIEISPSSAELLDGTPSKAEIDDEAEIEIVDDTPPEDRNRKPAEPPDDVTDEELENYSEKVRKRIQHFSRGYHDERRAKEAALREKQELESLARKLVEENKRLQGSFGKSQSVLLDQAKKVVEQQINTAKLKYKEAYESGDPDKILEAQDLLDDARDKRKKLEGVRLPALQPDEDGVQQQADEPKVQSSQTPKPDPKAVEWANRNEWFGQDDEMTSYAWGYHNKLVKEGVDPRSDDYYEKLDSRMRRMFPENFKDGETVEVEPQQRKPSPNVVAPATRSTAPRKVQLTKSQVSIARQLGIPLEIYAKQVAEEMRKSNG